MCTSLHTCALACLWRPEDNCGESILTFYHVGLWDCAQVIRLGRKCPYPLSRSAGPHKVLLSKGSPRSTLARVAWCLLYARLCFEYFPWMNCCPPQGNSDGGGLGRHLCLQSCCVASGIRGQATCFQGLCSQPLQDTAAPLGRKGVLL